MNENNQGGSSAPEREVIFRETYQGIPPLCTLMIRLLFYFDAFAFKKKQHINRGMPCRRSKRQGIPLSLLCEYLSVYLY